jgi:hypothetical protein
MTQRASRHRRRLGTLHSRPQQARSLQLFGMAIRRDTCLDPDSLVGPMLPPLARPAEAPSPGPASHRRIDNLGRRREAIDGEQAEDRRRHGCHDHHHQFVVAHPRPAWFPTTLFVSSHDDLYFPVKHPA